MRQSIESNDVRSDGVIFKRSIDIEYLRHARFTYFVRGMRFLFWNHDCVTLGHEPPVVSAFPTTLIHSSASSSRRQTCIPQRPFMM